jgi:hypothetical protein
LQETDALPFRPETIAVTAGCEPAPDTETFSDEFITIFNLPRYNKTPCLREVFAASHTWKRFESIIVVYSIHPTEEK